MEDKMIKIENPRSVEYQHRYIFPNGRDEFTYTWKASTEKTAIVVTVPEYVYVDIRDNTTAFRKGKLKIAKVEEDEQVKEEIEYLTEDVKVYTVKEITELLNGNINKLKKELTKDTDKSIIQDFARVAKDIKLDSRAKLAYLSELMGVEDLEYVFPQEEN